MKNGDRLRVNALKEVADNLDLNVYLCLIDVYELWECHDDAEWSYKRRHHYWEYDEEVESEEEPEDDYTLGDLINFELNIKHCIDSIGKAIKNSHLSIYEHEVFSTKSMEEFMPFESEYEGYMGNYGNTMDRWYHRAAIILWRKVDNYLMLLESNPKEFLKAIMPLAKKKKERENVQRIVERVLPAWVGLTDDSHIKDIVSVLQLALLVDNPENAVQLLEPLNEKALCKDTINELLELADVYGVNWCTNILSMWLTNSYKQPIIIGPLVSIIRALLSESSENRQLLTQWLLRSQLID